MRYLFVAAAIVVAHPQALAQLVESVDVDTLVRRARSSPNVALAEVGVETAEATYRGTQPLLPNPQVSLSFGRRQPANGFEVQAQIQQPLDIAGQRRSRRRAARMGVESAERSHQWSLRFAEQEVRRWAYRAIIERERIAIATQAREVAERIRTTALMRVEAGEASPLDVLLAETEVARARRNELAAELREQRARTQLAQLVDWSDPQVPVVRGELPELSEPAPLEQLVARTRESLALTPARAALRASEAAVEAADRGAVPNPSVGAYYGREGDAQTAHVWLVTLGLPLPLWRRNQPARETARASVFQRERELEVAERMIRSRVALLRATLAAAYATARVYETTGLQSVRQSLARTQRAFELGELSLLDVTQMRQRVLLALDEWMEARRTYYDAATRLEAFVTESRED